MPGPCGIIRTLTIAFVPPSVPPANGYTVKWRAVGDLTWNIVTNLYSIPITIPGVPGCFNLEGTIEANCAGGNTSQITTFAVTGSSTNCQNVTFLQTSAYTYIPCGDPNNTPVVIANDSMSPTTDCVVTGSITGGTYTVNSSCS